MYLRACAGELPLSWLHNHSGYPCSGRYLWNSPSYEGHVEESQDLVLLDQVLLLSSAGSLQNKTVFKVCSNYNTHSQVCFNSLQDGLLACFSMNVFVYFHLDSYVNQCLSSRSWLSGILVSPSGITACLLWFEPSALCDGCFLKQLQNGNFQCYANSFAKSFAMV